MNNIFLALGRRLLIWVDLVKLTPQQSFTSASITRSSLGQLTIPTRILATYSSSRFIQRRQKPANVRCGRFSPYSVNPGER